ncbi:MAG: HprK-related kinase B [Gammaproteobacteria bacterium]|nr:HprK-related kinase B [Gammaproteobacteria bacterium]
MDDISQIKTMLLDAYPLLPERLCLRLQNYRLAIRSNSAALIERMQIYFAHVVERSCEQTQGEVIAIERDIVDTGLAFVDWKREPGKTGRKDAIYDLSDGRVVRKVRTGMLFLQSAHTLIAAGPCLEYDNQVINFINSQFLNWLQKDGYLLCHAAALSRQHHGLAIAGLSGGGKSTLMLNLLEDEATTYVTNDRLCIRKQQTTTQAVGIPKLPRINPGTIVNNARLFPLIAAPMREKLLQMNARELWKLEQKYDVDISALYGPDRILHETELNRFLVLNWQHDSAEPLQLEQVDITQRQDLLAAILKPSGPFYLDASGLFNTDDAMPDAAAYLAALEHVAVYEATGRVDFKRLTALCGEKLMD